MKKEVVDYARGVDYVDGTTLVTPMFRTINNIVILDHDGAEFVLSQKVIFEMLSFFTFKTKFKLTRTHLVSPTINENIPPVDKEKHNWVKSVLERYKFLLEEWRHERIKTDPGSSFAEYLQHNLNDDDDFWRSMGYVREEE